MEDGDEDVVHISELKPDPENARLHTPRNVGMIVDALQEVGAARSIVIDEDNIVLAGNATVEAAGQVDMTRVRVVEASGNEIIAVRRRGLSEEQKKRLALYDNRTAELADWNTDILRNANDENLLQKMWSDEEIARLLQTFSATEVSAPNIKDGDRSPFQQMTFTLHDEQAEEIKAALDKAKSEGGSDSPVNENSNGNALTWICQNFNHQNG